MFNQGGRGDGGGPVMAPHRPRQIKSEAQIQRCGGGSGRGCLVYLSNREVSPRGQGGGGRRGPGARRWAPLYLPRPPPKAALHPPPQSPPHPSTPPNSLETRGDVGVVGVRKRSEGVHIGGLLTLPKAQGVNGGGSGGGNGSGNGAGVAPFARSLARGCESIRSLIAEYNVKSTETDLVRFTESVRRAALGSRADATAAALHPEAAMRELILGFLHISKAWLGLRGVMESGGGEGGCPGAGLPDLRAGFRTWEAASERLLGPLLLLLRALPEELGRNLFRSSDSGNQSEGDGSRAGSPVKPSPAGTPHRAPTPMPSPQTPPLAVGAALQPTMVAANGAPFELAVQTSGQCHQTALLFPDQGQMATRGQPQETTAPNHHRPMSAPGQPPSPQVDGEERYRTILKRGADQLFEDPGQHFWESVVNEVLKEEESVEGDLESEGVEGRRPPPLPRQIGFYGPCSLFARPLGPDLRPRLFRLLTALAHVSPSNLLPGLSEEQAMKIQNSVTRGIFSKMMFLLQSDLYEDLALFLKAMQSAFTKTRLENKTNIAVVMAVNRVELMFITRFYRELDLPWYDA